MVVGDHLLLFAILSLLVSVICAIASSVPAAYIFGDSSVDVGNNNFLSQSTFRSNFPPNGIDFAEGAATGRFSNGLNTADFLAELLELERSPPSFLSLNNRTLPYHAARGVNFASARSRILEDTTGVGTEKCSKQRGWGSIPWHGYCTLAHQYIPMSKQLQQFATTRRKGLVEPLGAYSTEELLSKSIFFVSVGSDDLLDHYATYGPVNRTEKISYLNALKTTYKLHLQRLYELGARKVGVLSIPPIGCFPAVRNLSPSGDCSEDLNEFARLFYESTSLILRELSDELEGFKYALGNLYEMYTYFFVNAASLGFRDIIHACCGAAGGDYNDGEPCNPNSTVCSYRDHYLFWDWLHPTDAACKLEAKSLFVGPEEFVTPINFGQLAED